MTVNVYTETIHQLAASTAVVQRLIIHSMHSKEFKTSTICLQICRHQKREEYDKNCRLQFAYKSRNNAENIQIGILANTNGKINSVDSPKHYFYYAVVLCL